jgi:WD40 repeat protein
MAVYPTASIVATGCKVNGSDNNIVFWSLIEGFFEQKCILSKPHGSRVFSIDFSEDGSMMVTGCLDHWLRMFRNTGRVGLDYQVQHVVNTCGGGINMTVFMPNCSGIISVSSNGTSVEEFKILGDLTMKKQGCLKKSSLEDCVIAMRIYTNPPILAMVLQNGILELWNTSYPDKPFELCARIRFPLSLKGRNGRIICADLHPTIPMAAIGTHNGHQVMQFVNCQEDWSGIHVPMRNAPPICVHDGDDINPNRVYSLAFNEKNNQLAVGGCNGRVDIFQFSPNFSTQSYILRVGGIVKQGINSLMFDPKSNRLLITTYGKPGKMSQW